MADLFQYAFMRNAFVAGTLAAALAGVIGYFVVLRGEAFAGHTLSLAAFPGAAGAVLLGLPQLLGVALLCSLSSIGIAAVGGGAASGRPTESASVGTIQAFALALGLLFASLYRGLLNGVDGILFGSFLGITEAQVWGVAAIASAGLGALAIAGRPLLFLSIDPVGAAAAGVPVRTVSIGFLLLLGLSAAAVVLISGALLMFTLLVVPAAAAREIAARPSRAILLGVALGLLMVWASLTLAYFTDYPVGFFLTSIGFGLYLAARAGRRIRLA